MIAPDLLYNILFLIGIVGGSVVCSDEIYTKYHPLSNYYPQKKKEVK